MFSINSGQTKTIISAIFSLLIATALWYFVVGRDHVEMQFEIRVEYQGLSESLTILDGNVNRLTVRLRGSEELLKSLRSSSMSYTVDLSSMHPGANQIALNVAGLPFIKDRGVEILQVSPSQIVLQIDNVITRNVHVRPRILPPSKDLPFILQEGSVADPSMVAVRGPETILSSIRDELVTAPIDTSKNAREGEHKVQAAITAPASLEISMPVVTVTYLLNLKTKNVNINVPVRIESQNASDYELGTDKLNINIAYPTENAKDSRYAMMDVTAVVKIPDNMLPGESLRLPVSFEGLPPQAAITSGASSHVLVTRKKVQQQPQPDSTPSEVLLQQKFASPIFVPLPYFKLYSIPQIPSSEPNANAWTLPTYQHDAESNTQTFQPFIFRGVPTINFSTGTTLKDKHTFETQE